MEWKSADQACRIWLTKQNHFFKFMNFIKKETIEKIEENPYQLVEDVKGVGFKTADKIASSLGIEADSLIDFERH